MDVVTLQAAKREVARSAYVAPGCRLYNPRGLRRWAAALSDALDGAAVISVYGDSISKGVGSDGSSSDSSATTYPTQGWVGQLRRLFAATYGDPGEGSIGTLEGGSRWTFAGGGATTASIGPYENGGRATAATQSITVNVSACIQVDIWTWGGSGPGQATYAVDGGGSTAFTAGDGNANSTTWNKTSITGVANTTHTLVITGPVSGAIVFVAAVVALKQTTGVQVHRFGKSGNTTANLVGQDSSLNGNASGQARMVAVAAKVPTSDLLIVSLGVNDFGNQNSTAASGAQPGTTPTTYKANLQAVVDQAVTNGACVLLLGEPRQNSGNYPSPMTYVEQDYYDQAKAIAVGTDHCAFMDTNDVWGSNVLGQARGFYTTSSVHPTRKGHGSMARLVHRALTTPFGENAATA